MLLEPRRYDDPDVAPLVEQIQAYYERIYGGRDRDPTEAAQFEPPDGIFLVGFADGVPVACGGWRRRPDDTVEIKRMYVDPARRGRGMARAVLAELERTAAESGARRIVLNTGFRQPEAMAFYVANGYVETDERYGVYADQQGAFFYVKTLNGPPRGGGTGRGS